MYLYIFLFCFGPSMRNNGLGGLTYTVPDYYYRLNAYDFGRLTAGLILDDSSISYIDGYYLVDKDSLLGTFCTKYGHLRFNNKQKIALDVNLNKDEYFSPYIGDIQGISYSSDINTSAGASYAINNKMMLGIGGEKKDIYYLQSGNSYHYSYVHLNGSFLYNSKFSWGSKVEYKYMDYPETLSYNSTITVGLYSLIPVMDNFKVGIKIDEVKQDTSNSFSVRIRFEFIPLKEIIVGGEIMETNSTGSHSPSYFYPRRTKFLTLGMGYRKDPILIGVETCSEGFEYSSGEDTYSMAKLGVEIHKRGMYIRGGINNSTYKLYNFSFGMGYRYRNRLNIDYFYNREEWHFHGFDNEGNANGFSLRIIF